MLSYIKSVGGNTSLAFALSIVPFAGVIGVAIDMARLADVKTDVAAALDGAVLAGSSAEANHVAAAEAYFAANFLESSVSRLNAKFTLEDEHRVVGVVKGSLKTSLTSVLGFQDMEILTTATADRSVGKGPLCVLALAPNTSQALLLNSGADINAKDCEIHVKSTANPAAILNAGIKIEAYKICIQGSTIIDNGSGVQNVEKSCKTDANPYSSKFPVPSSSTCDYSNLNYSGKTTLNPGVYCGWHNFNAGADVDLNPGTYIIKSGGWNVNGGTWKGTGVTFYYADTSKIQFNSGVKAQLKAPTTGTYKGVLFAETEGLSDSQFVLDDSLGFDMEGIIYLPSREIVVNSGTSMHSQKLTAVMRTMIFNGSKWDIQNYDDTGSTQAQLRLIK